jgi:hypothetical protein
MHLITSQDRSSREEWRRGHRQELQELEHQLIMLGVQRQHMEEELNLIIQGQSTHTEREEEISFSFYPLFLFS